MPDEGIEDVLYDSQAGRCFVGIDLGPEPAPNATTLLKVHRLLEKGLTKSIFNAINVQLAEKKTVSAARHGSGRHHHRRAALDQEPQR